jgi:hypothetical protein
MKVIKGKKWLAGIVMAACLLTLATGAPEARENSASPKHGARPGYLPGEVPVSVYLDVYVRDLHLGALWFPNISDRSYIGYYDISGYYPGGGQQSTVWNAGMCAGGHVWIDADSLFNPIPWVWKGFNLHADPYLYDTLEAAAIVRTEEDLGKPYPYRQVVIRVNTADKPTYEGSAGLIDGDTGMTVNFKWHQWGVEGYDHWVFVDARIEFGKAIEDFYWGWLSDCDVGYVYKWDYYYEDYAGWNDSLRFCYMRDWDYDPLEGQPPAASTEDSVFLSPSMVGQYLLAAPPVGGPVTADPDTAQKWATANYWDWNNDYGAIRELYDRLTGTWQNTFPSPTPFDYRILNAVGPYDVAAGDTAHFWMAYVMGEGYEDDSHSRYDMGPLIDHVADARAFFDGGMVIPSSAVAPKRPDLNPDLDTDITGDTLRVHWGPYEEIPGGVTADSFFVHTSTEGRVGPWQRVAAFPDSVTETCLTLDAACTYVWVQAYDTGNQVGSNPHALRSRLYQRDSQGIIRANEETIICAPSPMVGVPAGLEFPCERVSNHPNPFSPATTITYSVMAPGRISLRVYDVSGALVRTLAEGEYGRGEHHAEWDGTAGDGSQLAPGIYFASLRTPGGRVTTRRLVLLR